MKKRLKVYFVLSVLSLLFAGCNNNTPPALEEKSDLSEKQCSMGTTYHILEKSNIVNQEGEKGYALASEFQSEPVLLTLGSELYSKIEEDNSYYITFEGKISIPNIETALIPTTYVISNLKIMEIEKVEPKGLENHQQPLSCK